MISNALDYTAIASWSEGRTTYLVQVASLLERPISLVIESEHPDKGLFNAIVPTEADWIELIGFWNSSPDAERREFVDRAFAAK